MNLIAVPFAYDEKKNSGINFRNKSGGKWKLNTYLKNACVALISAKKNNPLSEVALVTNIENLPEEYCQILKNNGICIKKVGFEQFVFPGDYKWSLAFYKLCALNSICSMDYENICYLDTDVYIQESFDYIWEECESNLLLYDLSKGFNIQQRKMFYDEAQKVFGCKCFPTHYGGEFFAASNKIANDFLSICKQIYETMLEMNLKTNYGDEFIISMAAMKYEGRIKNAASFIQRFWTGSSCRDVPSVYKRNKVAILHVPAEKERGMVCLYDNYFQKNRIPKEKTVWETFRFCNLSLLEIGKLGIVNLLKKIRK